MSSATRQREMKEAIEREVAKYEAVSIAFDRNGQRPFALLTFGDQSRKVFYSDTVGDRNAFHYVARDARKALRELGATIAETAERNGDKHSGGQQKTDREADDVSSAKRRRELEETLEREIEDWPGVTLAFEGHRNGGHLSVKLSFRGQDRRYFYACTPSDWRANANTLSDVRRTLRELGATRRQEDPKYRPAVNAAANAPRPQSPPRPQAVARPLPREVERHKADRATAAPSPLDPLRELQRRNTLRALSNWAGKKANQERLDEAARLLLAGWHPDIVNRAKELMDDALGK